MFSCRSASDWNAVTFCELIASISVLSGVPILSRCFAHSTRLAATCEPSSAGGLALKPLMLCEVYGEVAICVPSVWIACDHIQNIGDIRESPQSDAAL